MRAILVVSHVVMRDVVDLSDVSYREDLCLPSSPHQRRDGCLSASVRVR